MRMILEFFKDHMNIVIATAIISLIFIYLATTQGMSPVGITKLGSLDNSMVYSDVKAYDGMPLKSKLVKDFVNKYYKSSSADGAFTIKINNYNGGNALTSSTVTLLASDTYMCSVTSDSDGKVTLVSFVKQ